MTVIVLALLIAPTSPAVFASSSPRMARRPKPAMPLVGPAENLAADTESTEVIEPVAVQTPPPKPSALRITQSLTGRSATPWVPPNLWATALSPDGRYKLEARSAAGATRITLLNVSDGFKVDLSSDGIQCVSFAADGRFASGHQDGNVRVWDSATGGIALNLKGSDAEITSVAFSRDGSLVAAGNAEGQLLVWDATPGDDRTRDPRYELAAQGAAIGCVRWSPADGRLAISLAAWNDAQPPELLVWNPSDDEITQRLPLDRPAGAISWLGDNSVLAAHWDGMASIWQLDRGEIVSRMELDKNALSAAAWSSDCPLVPRGRAMGLLEMP
jgi:WD40 repeat protein